MSEAIESSSQLVVDKPFDRVISRRSDSYVHSHNVDSSRLPINTDNKQFNVSMSCKSIPVGFHKNDDDMSVSRMSVASSDAYHSPNRAVSTSLLMKSSPSLADNLQFKPPPPDESNSIASLRWKDAASKILSRTKVHGNSADFLSTFSSVLHELRCEVFGVDSSSAAAPRPDVSLSAESLRDWERDLLQKNLNQREREENERLAASQVKRRGSSGVVSNIDGKDASEFISGENSKGEKKALHHRLNSDFSSSSAQIGASASLNLTLDYPPRCDIQPQITLSNVDPAQKEKCQPQDHSLTAINRTFSPSVSQLMSSWLLDTYMCALVKGVFPFQGKMYLTESHIFFHSIFSSNTNDLFKQTHLSIAFRDILNIKKTTYILPTAVTITTKCGEKIQFASLLQRDETFKILSDLWDRSSHLRNAILPLPLTPSTVAALSVTEAPSANEPRRFTLCCHASPSSLAPVPSYIPLISSLNNTTFKVHHTSNLPAEKLVFGIERALKQLCEPLAQRWEGVEFPNIPLSKVLHHLYLKRHQPGDRVLLNEWLDVARNKSYPPIPFPFKDAPETVEEITFPFVTERTYSYDNYVTSTKLTKMIGVPEYAISTQTDVLVFLTAENVILETRVQADGIPMSSKFHIGIRYHFESINEGRGVRISSEFDALANNSSFFLLSSCRTIALGEWEKARVVFMKLVAMFIMELELSGGKQSILNVNHNSTELIISPGSKCSWESLEDLSKECGCVNDKENAESSAYKDANNQRVQTKTHAEDDKSQQKRNKKNIFMFFGLLTLIFGGFALHNKLHFDEINSSSGFRMVSGDVMQSLLAIRDGSKLDKQLHNTKCQSADSSQCDSLEAKELMEPLTIGGCTGSDWETLVSCLAVKLVKAETEISNLKIALAKMTSKK
eukprot:GDKJ01014928.1.p1 GENE.GDKJ01014928.1~~GDKJ01014928.1.p1  ORF type:complete len:900 (-),score=192.54 GDKJ01014928.1:427-3126(-)